MTPTIKNGGCNKYYMALKEVCSTFTQNLRGKKTWGRMGWVSVQCALSGQTFFFPSDCYYRPSSWVLIQSWACSYKPWGFEVVLDWLGGFHQGINSRSPWTRISGPSTLTCVGLWSKWSWRWWRQDSWLCNMGQYRPRLWRHWCSKSQRIMILNL